MVYLKQSLRGKSIDGHLLADLEQKVKANEAAAGGISPFKPNGRILFQGRLFESCREEEEEEEEEEEKRERKGENSKVRT